MSGRTFPEPGEWVCFRGSQTHDGRSRLRGALAQPRIAWRQLVGSVETTVVALSGVGSGSVCTNLKLNQRDVDMNHPGSAERERALAVYRDSVDAAAILGARWVRPLPGADKPDMALHIDGYRGLAASPDTGSWEDHVRYEGQARCFPLALTCDFKAFVLGPNGEHADYDLQRCWQLGHDAGFSGPWCFEHWHESLPDLIREPNLLQDMIAGWSAAGSPRRTP